MIFRYSACLQYSSTQDLNLLEEEFLHYQAMWDSEIPQKVWDEALVKEDKGQDIRKYRMDVIWSFLSQMKEVDGRLILGRLARVALLVLTIPHSNTEEERVLSLVTKNKTKFRPNLKLNGTLGSLLTINLANKQHCYQIEPTDTVIDIVKKAAMKYNQAYSCKT